MFIVMTIGVVCTIAAFFINLSSMELAKKGDQLLAAIYGMIASIYLLIAVLCLTKVI